MANLYILFTSPTERRAFLLDLLQIDRADFSSPELKGYLEALDEGKTKGPYYRLCERFYMRRVSDEDASQIPWSPAIIFKKGFRRLYTQKSYLRKSGFWLVVQLRYDETARKRYRWIYTSIPYDRILTSTPPRREQVEKWKEEAATMKRRYAALASNMEATRSMLLDDKLNEIAEVLDGYVSGDRVPYSMTLDDIFNYLDDLKESTPEAFIGDHVYLWERLGFIYDHVGHLARMEYCLRTQASLQPGYSDAFLNLGGFWTNHGQYGKAIAAYQEGLQVDPKDEYIYHNLAELYRTTGNREAALAQLNSAIVENPGRGINHKLKADIHFEWGAYAPAILAYEHAIDCFDEEGWHSFSVACLIRMATAHKMLGQLDEALTALLSAVMIDPNSPDVRIQLAMLYAKELDCWPDAANHARIALELDPKSPQACFLLAEFHRHEGDEATSKWYFKRGKQLENQMIP